MKNEFEKKLKDAESLPDIFELVKEIVWKTIRKSRAGLELGLAEMGNSPQGFLGAYYVGGSNVIIMNQTPLKRIQETNPKLLKPYIFTVLTHEYLHSLGYFDEIEVRNITHSIICEAFGHGSVLCDLSKDITKFFPNLIYPEGAIPFDTKIKLVKDFDKSSIRYIG